MWQLWLAGLVGIWLIISPWVYNFTSNTGAFWNSIVFGAVTLILAWWAGAAQKNKNS